MTTPAAADNSTPTGQADAGADNASDKSGDKSTDTDKGKGSDNGGDTGKSGDGSVLGGGEAPKPDGKGNQGPAGGTAKKPTDTAGEIEVKLPEGFEVNEQAMGDFKSMAKEAGLKSEQAQQFVDFYAAQQQAVVESFEAQNQKWVEELKADKEFGGEKFEENAKQAHQLAVKILGQDVLDDLTSHGLGNLPSLARRIWALKDKFAEDSDSVKKEQKPGFITSQDQLRKEYPSMFNEDGTPKQ